MKKLLKISVVILCVAVFASLLFVAMKQTGLGGTMPKAPIYASFTPIARSVDPTSISIELPEDHNADEVVLYFGDELGRFNDPIGTYEVTATTMVCQISGDVSCPENATKIWVYTRNEKGISDTGCSVDLYPSSSLALDDGIEDAEKNFANYPYITVIAALVISLLGYVWLGKKPAENEEKSEEENG